MKSNLNTIDKFYTSFANGDAEKMISCYADNIVFQDPAFGILKGTDAMNMWRMLIERSKGGIEIEYKVLTIDDVKGSVQWKATYVYSGTGRKVENHITARFEFIKGKIITHTDDFDLWSWTRQALGAKGYLLGWSSFMKNKIQQQTNTLLNRYVEKSIRS